MKKTLLTIVGLLITLFAFARDNYEQNPKYGKGAVPQDENGDVYFTQTVDIPENISEDICYEILMNWAKGRFAQPYAQSGRILNEDSQTAPFHLPR